jgi:TolA-binding protein
VNIPRFSVLAVACVLSACAGTKKDDTPTLKSLENKRIALDADQRIDSSEQKAIAAYREFMKVAPRDPLRPEALRRVGDYEMRQAEARELGETAEPAARSPRPNVRNTGEYRNAVALYQELLKTYPRYPGNDRVLYQLARAQELNGDLEKALVTLNRLVAEYPKTMYREEAQFRRGEVLFTTRAYSQAQQAYESILQLGEASPFHERALYMHGWSHFKQLQFDPALHSFFKVLDRKLIGRIAPGTGTELPSLSRADKELVEDTFRAVSLSLSVTDGAAVIPRYVTAARADYEYLVYRELGDLYQRQERVKDAADTYAAFAALHPTHPQSPHLTARVIEVYQQAGFAALAIDAKKTFVSQYGVASAYRKANPSSYHEVVPLLRKHIEELAQHFHASAQKSKQSADYREAAHWYHTFLRSFPGDPKAPAMNFLLAEMMYEDRRYAEAAVEYEMTAYHYPHHAKSADAGYAALLAYAEQEKRSKDKDKLSVQRTATESALRFATANPGDPRTAAVLTSTAEKLYALNDPDRARMVAQRVLVLQPPASAALKRTAWTVVAHTEFERGAFEHAERAYQQVLAALPDKDPARTKTIERLAASVYKQAEQARATGRHDEAVAHFLRVGQVAPQSSIRATAEYDAAAVLIAAKKWTAATQVLETFRSRYPKHPLQDEVTNKLAASYLESGQWSAAAVELERLAAVKKEPNLAREALWQAGELYEKAGKHDRALALYERYVKQNPEPLEAAIEARHRLAMLNKQQGQTARYQAWLKDLVKTEQAAGRARTDRTRYLGATAAMVLAEPVYEEYRRVALVEPLKKSLKIKKARMEDALKVYGQAADYGVAEVATASTFRIAEIYHDFSKSLIGSQRPKGLSADELEQYNVLLEEQAYPFEEKAIELHETNARRTAQGLYDSWIRNSYTALGKLRPVRYAKTEKSEVAIDAIR